MNCVPPDVTRINSGYVGWHAIPITMSLFGKSNYTFIKVKRKEIPAGVWTKCPGCESPAYSKELRNNLNVCPKCGFHLGLNARERIEHLIDAGTFVEHDTEMVSADPLKFQGP